MLITKGLSSWKTNMDNLAFIEYIEKFEPEIIDLIVEKRIGKLHDEK